MNESRIKVMEVTTQIYNEAIELSQKTKKDHILYTWNIQEDSFDYVIAAADEEIPEVVQSPYVTRRLNYKEKFHE